MYNVDLIKANADLLSIAEMAGAEFHRAGNEWRSACPLHGGDNRSGFAVYDDGEKWCCFTNDCGQGDVITFVQKWKGLDFQGACNWLGGERSADPLEAERIKNEQLEKRVKRLEEQTQKHEFILKDMTGQRKWEEYNQTLEDNQRYQDIWTRAGIPPSWQSFWQLGYCEKFTAMSDGELFTSPSLTIPIFENEEIRNIKHRLLNPHNPHDKYRPERPGLGSIPFYSDSTAMYDKEYILYVEGEKKAMVTFLTLDSPKWQVIGIPGKNQWKKEAEKLNGQRIITLFDPDAIVEAQEFSKLTGGRYIDISMKVDDAINMGYLNKAGLKSLMIGAARP